MSYFSSLPPTYFHCISVLWICTCKVYPVFYHFSPLHQLIPQSELPLACISFSPVLPASHSLTVYFQYQPVTFADTQANHHKNLLDPFTLLCKMLSWLCQAQNKICSLPWSTPTYFSELICYPSYPCCLLLLSRHSDCPSNIPPPSCPRALVPAITSTGKPLSPELCIACSFTSGKSLSKCHISQDLYGRLFLRQAPLPFTGLFLLSAP